MNFLNYISLYENRFMYEFSMHEKKMYKRKLQEHHPEDTQEEYPSIEDKAYQEQLKTKNMATVQDKPGNTMCRDQVTHKEQTEPTINITGNQEAQKESKDETFINRHTNG